MAGMNTPLVSPVPAGPRRISLAAVAAAVCALGEIAMLPLSWLSGDQLLDFLMPVAGLAAVVCGTAALAGLDRRRERGLGLAVTSLVIGGLGLLSIVYFAESFALSIAAMG